MQINQPEAFMKLIFPSQEKSIFNKSIYGALIGLFFIHLLSYVHAASRPATNLSCETNHKRSLSFIFKDERVKITINKLEQYEQPGATRDVASSEVNFDIARSRWNGLSVEKIAMFENKKHTIHIQNVEQPSNIDDYISIRDSEGHEIIYPLDCKKI